MKADFLVSLIFIFIKTKEGRAAQSAAPGPGRLVLFGLAAVAFGLLETASDKAEERSKETTNEGDGDNAENGKKRDLNDIQRAPPARQHATKYPFCQPLGLDFNLKNRLMQRFFNLFSLQKIKH